MNSLRGAGWRLARGATPLGDGSVRFGVWAPAARELAVRLAGPAGGAVHPLVPRGAGAFGARIPGVPPGTDYFYRIDGRDRPDPVSRHRPAGVHGPSRVVDPDAFRWTDGDWGGVAAADLIIYELHVGTFTPAGTFGAAAERIADLRELGVTAIEVMPVAEFPGGRNWGYDGVSLYAAQSTYGGPDGLKGLVDAAHEAGLAVLLDVVYNHLGPEGNYLADFGPYFEGGHRTPWGPGWNLDGPDSDEVRRYLVDNALYWINEFHLDGLRLDAADTIVDLSACHLLEQLAGEVRTHCAALGRPVTLIAESDANDPRYIRPRELGGYGLDAQWTDDFHHAVHVALTGEGGGRYVDFGGVAPVAKTLAERFVNDGRYSPYRRRRFGRPAADLPGHGFVVCVQNHDQVGNRIGGERLAALVPPEALRLAACVLLLSPYLPLLFMGEEHGETNPFFYFVSHGDPALTQAVRDGRRREFGASAPEGGLPDPGAEATFLASRVDWSRAACPPNAGLRRLYRDLLRLRRADPALRPGGSREVVRHDAEAGWVSLQRTAPGRSVLAAFNFAPETRTVEAGAGRAWHLILSSEDRLYDGRGRTVLAGGAVVLPPLGAALLGDAP